jgi:hypothetical protein
LIFTQRLHSVSLSLLQACPYHRACCLRPAATRNRAFLLRAAYHYDRAPHFDYSVGIARDLNRPIRSLLRLGRATQPDNSIPIGVNSQLRQARDMVVGQTHLDGSGYRRVTDELSLRYADYIGLLRISEEWRAQGGGEQAGAERLCIHVITPLLTASLHCHARERSALSC